MKLLAVMPCSSLSRRLTIFADKLGVAVEVHEGFFEQAEKIAAQGKQKGFQAIIAHGGTAAILKQRDILPVVTLKVRGSDVLSAMQQCTFPKNQIAVVTHDMTYQDPELFEKLGGVAYITYSTKQDLDRHLDRLLKEKQIKCIIGGAYSVKWAENNGLFGVLVEPSDECYVDAVHDAVHLVDNLLREKIRTEELRAILQSSEEGVMVVDKNRKIKFVNNKLLKMLDMEADPTGLPLSEVIKQPKLCDEINQFQEKQGIMAEFNDCQAIVSLQPIEKTVRLSP